MPLLPHGPSHDDGHFAPRGMERASSGGRGWAAASARCLGAREAVARALRDFCAGPLGRGVTGYRPPPTPSARRLARDAAAAADATPPSSPASPPSRARRAPSDVESSTAPPPPAASALAPTLSVALTVTCLAVLCVGLSDANFARDLDAVWVPPRSTALAQRRLSESLFGADPFARPVRVIVAVDGAASSRPPPGGASETLADADGCAPPRVTDGALTSPSRLAAAFALRDAIAAITVDDDDAPSGGNRTRALGDLCSRSVPDDPASPCVEFSPLGYWPEGPAAVADADASTLRRAASAALHAGTLPVEQRRVLGCVTRRENHHRRVNAAERRAFGRDSDSDAFACDASALTFTFFLDPTTRPEILVAWERELVAVVADARDVLATESLVAEVHAGDASTSAEIEAQERADAGVLAASYVAMAFVAGVFLADDSRAPFVFARLPAGFAGVAMVALAAFASLGLCAAFLEFTPIAVRVVPYLLVAVGVDHLFIVARQYDIGRAKERFGGDRGDGEGDDDDEEEDGAGAGAGALRPRSNSRSRRRIPASTMARSLGVSVPSMIITTTTSCAALLVAGTTSVPALRGFCIVAGVGVVVAVAPTIAAFPAVFLLGERLRDAATCAADRRDRASDSRESSSVDPRAENRIVASENGSRAVDLETRLARAWVRALDDARVRGFVVVAYLAALAVSIRAATTVEVGIDPREMTRDGEPLGRFLELEARCGSHLGPPAFVVIEGVDFVRGDPRAVDRGWRALSDAVADDPTTESRAFGWWDAFRVWTAYHPPATDDAEGTCDALRRFLEDSVEGAAFKNDVAAVWKPASEKNQTSEDGVDAAPVNERELPCEVVASRIRTAHVPLRDSREYVAAIRSTRDTVASAVGALGPNARAFPISAEYVYYEQFLTQRREHLVRMVAAVVAVVVVVFVAMDAAVAAFVGVAMASIAVMTFAALKPLGLRLNAVSSILLVAVVGLADEYVCHVAYAVARSREESTNAKLADALAQFARPVTAMAATSVVGTSLLVAASSPVLRDYFFPILAVAVAVSWAHGCVVLPAAVSATRRDARAR